MLCLLLFEVFPSSLCLCEAICVSAKQHSCSLLAYLSLDNLCCLDRNWHFHTNFKCEAIIQPMQRKVHVTDCKVDLQNQQARAATASSVPACTTLLARGRHQRLRPPCLCPAPPPCLLFSAADPLPGRRQMEWSHSRPRCQCSQWYWCVCAAARITREGASSFQCSQEAMDGAWWWQPAAACTLSSSWSQVRRIWLSLLHCQ